MIPYKFYLDVVVELTSTALVAQKLSPMTEGEFLQYIGMWLLMSTSSGWTRNDFWSTKEYDAKTNACPFNFTKYMSKKRFDAITRELRFTNVAPPPYRDRFWEVRQMIKAWNDHMADSFVPSWALCLDESMSIWHSWYTCPGWVFCPRKPHPFRN